MAIMSKPLTATTVDAAEKQRPAHWFKPGQSGNPSGRRVGSRVRHSENFLATFAADFEQYGAQVIAKVRTEMPHVYLKIAADLLPKQATLDVDVSVTRALDAVSAFRLLQSLPRHELEQLRNDAVNTGD
jgi:hypothetical protein